MGWTIGIVALGLAMTVLTVAELWQCAKTHASNVPALSLADSVIGAFVVVTFGIAFLNGLMLLAANIWP
jgi:hypothetical protein